MMVRQRWINPTDRVRRDAGRSPTLARRARLANGIVRRWTRSSQCSRGSSVAGSGTASCPSRASLMPQPRSAPTGSPRPPLRQRGTACGMRSSSVRLRRSPYSMPTADLLPDPIIRGQDCLNLNVWTPAADSARRPVLVWIHGGAFLNGSGAVSTYDGSGFARDGVVCVTINYRLGADGFLAIDGAPAQPWAARPDRRAPLGTGQHRGVRRRSGRP